MNKRRLSLAAWVLIAMLAGILAGLLLQRSSAFTEEYLKPIGTIYINLLKFLVVPVVLLSITAGVISLKDIKRVGSVGLKTFAYYLVTTAVAVTIGLALAALFKDSFPALPGAELSQLTYTAKEAPKTMQVIVSIFPSNLLAPMVSGDMLPVIIIALLFGAGILAAGEKGRSIAKLVNDGNEVVMKVMMMIIKISPIGVFCLMTNVVAVNGAAIVGTLALVIGVTYLGYLLHALIVYCPSVKLLGGINPIAFFKGIYPAMICAFTTASSNAALPLNMRCCEKLGAESEISSFVLPLGATINMDGTAIYQAVATVFIAACYGMELTLNNMATVVLTTTLSSIGTAGVSGAGTIMLAMVLTTIGIPVEGMALIAGVDKLFDMGRTALNITGDATCALWISKLERTKKAKAAQKQGLSQVG